MSQRLLIMLAAGGSAALLLAAFGFQYLGDLPPCKLCIWQRWPHAGAVFLGALALLARGRAWVALGALAAGTTGGIAVYHTGVERAWWEGPSSCSSSGISGISVDELMEQIMSAPLVRCDEVPWDFLGLSMATWNGLASFALMGLWLLALRR